MFEQANKYRVAKHANGKKLYVGNTTQLFVTPKRMAFSLDMAESSAKDVIAGKTRKGWHIEPMQRRRENMRISYTLTKAGLEAATKRRAKERKGMSALEYPFSVYQIFLQNIYKGEASDIADAMIALGYEWGRRRVLIAGAEAVKNGHAVQSKLSGAIYGVK